MSTLKKTCEDLYDQLLARLLHNEGGSGTQLEKTSQAISICENFLDQLKVLVNQHNFTSKTEEIYFFKVIKPRFSSWFIYNSGILKFHTQWPSGSRYIQKEHVIAAIQKIIKFYRNNKSLYEYYRAGHSHLDEQFFVRSRISLRLFTDFVFNDMDHNFCTSHDGRIAQILAYDRLEKYLQDKLDEIENGTVEALPNDDFTWEYHKNALVEFVYGLQGMQPCRKKQLTIKEMARQVGKTFNINIEDDIYKIYNEMCQRKTDRTKFLDLMREKLLKRMDDDLE